MSLISPNAVSKIRLKNTTEDVDASLVVEKNKDNEDGRESDLETSRPKKRKREKERRLEIEQVKEMKKLENILSGSLYDPLEFGKEDEEQAQDEAETGSAVYFVDPSANSTLSVNEEYAHYTEWTQLDSWLRPYDESSDEEDPVMVACGYEDVEAFGDILRTDEDLLVKTSGKLSPGLLEYWRLVDENAEELSNGPKNSVQFHRKAQLLLVPGFDRKVRFFQIDGKHSTKIQSIFLEDCPVQKASFLPDGPLAIIAGRRKFFYSLDLVKAKGDKIDALVVREEKSLEFFEVSPDSSTTAFVGKEGYILLVSSKTKELTGTLKKNGNVRSLAFANDGKQLLSSGGDDGEVYQWDLRTRTCIHKAADEGCINCTPVFALPNGNFFAAGSDSGIVRVFRA